MFLNTRHFGKIEIDENKIIEFVDGLPGFNYVRQFIILETDQEGEESPFKWLQCVDDPTLAFAIANPFMLKADYDIELSAEVLENLEIIKRDDVAIYAIVVVPEDISKMTMNLKAPLVINSRNRKGMQTILNTDKYSVRHYIMDEKARQEVVANACTD